MHGLFLYFSFMKYFLYIFYRYYSRKKNNETAYWSAMFAMVAPAVLYCGAFYFYVFPENGVPDNNVCLIIFTIGLAIGYYFVWDFIKERHLKKPELAEKYKRHHGFLALLYVVGGIACAFLAGMHANKVEEDLMQKVIEARPADLQEVRFKPLEPETP